MSDRKRTIWVLAFIVICAIIAVVACARDAWILHTPREIPKELAYLAGMLVLGLLIICQPRWRYFRLALSLGLAMGNEGCAIWLWIRGGRTIAVVMAIVGVSFAIDLINQIGRASCRERV